MTTGEHQRPGAVLEHRFASSGAPWATLLHALEDRGPASLVVIDGIGPVGSAVNDPTSERVAKARVIAELRSAGLLSVIVFRDGSSDSPDAVTLALAGDIRWATPEARFASGSLAAGDLPFEAVADAAFGRLGRSRALALSLSTAPIDTNTAQAWGLIDDVIPETDLGPRIEDLVVKVVRASPSLLAELKALLTTGDADQAARRFTEASERLRSEGVNDA